MGRPGSHSSSALAQVHPSGSSDSFSMFAGAGSSYFAFQRSSVGGLPLDFILASSDSSQRRRRSARMRFSNSEAGSTSGFLARHSAVRSPRNAAASTDCRNRSSSCGMASSASFASWLLVRSAPILETIRPCSLGGGKGTRISRNEPIVSIGIVVADVVDDQSIARSQAATYSASPLDREVAAIVVCVHTKGVAVGSFAAPIVPRAEITMVVSPKTRFDAPIYPHGTFSRPAEYTGIPEGPSSWLKIVFPMRS